MKRCGLGMALLCAGFLLASPAQAADVKKDKGRPKAKYYSPLHYWAPTLYRLGQWHHQRDLPPLGEPPSTHHGHGKQRWGAAVQTSPH